ncbi:MAG: hypothetical protein CMJ78_13425 [Planctomycetaceae bacterium]|nr:hypothetical protein [Planctomycetaceae bacterium]
MKTESVQQDYASAIRAWAHGMATAKVSAVESSLALGDSMDRVKMFVEGNYEKRIDKLLRQAELLEDVVDDLEDRVISFMKEVPLGAYDTGCSDGDRFLGWLQDVGQLTLEQEDHVECQRARLKLEDVARANRVGHVWFQDLWSLTETALDEFDVDSHDRIHLNPIHVETRFETTSLLDDDDEAPTDVVVYACENNMRTAVLEPIAQRVCDVLRQDGPKSIDDLKDKLLEFDKDEIFEVCRDSVEMGLMALG